MGVNHTQKKGQEKKTLQSAKHTTTEKKRETNPEGARETTRH